MHIETANCQLAQQSFPGRPGRVFPTSRARKEAEEARQRFSFRPGTNGSRFFGKEARRFSRDQAFGLSSKQGAPEASEASAPALRRFLLASAVSATSRSGSPLSSQGVPSSCDNWLNKCRLCQELHFLKLTVGFDYRFGQGLVLPAPTRCVFFKIFVQNIHQILELLSVKYCE